MHIYLYKSHLSLVTRNVCVGIVDSDWVRVRTKKTWPNRSRRKVFTSARACWFCFISCCFPSLAPLTWVSACSLSRSHQHQRETVQSCLPHCLYTFYDCSPSHQSHRSPHHTTLTSIGPTLAKIVNYYSLIRVSRMRCFKKRNVCIII